MAEDDKPCLSSAGNIRAIADKNQDALDDEFYNHMTEINDIIKQRAEEGCYGVDILCKPDVNRRINIYMAHLRRFGYRCEYSSNDVTKIGRMKPELFISW